MDILFERVLLVNDLIACGGTEAQHWMEFELLKQKGHDVYSLTFDPDENECLCGPKLNIPVAQSLPEKAIRKFFRSASYSKVKRIIDRIEPCVVHLNNSVKIPVDVFDAVSDYPTVQTIRDYGAVCPKSTCTDSSWRQCGGFINVARCMKCGLTLNEKVKAISFAHLLDKRCKAVDCFVSPSDALAQTCSNVGMHVGTINDALNSNLLRASFNRGKTRDYLFYGGVRRIKGVRELIEAFDVFTANTQRRLLIAGKVEPDFEQEFNELRLRRPYIEYLGLLGRNEVMTRVANSYCVIVPSLWIENYPNTVLESMCHGTLVIGSNRGGIPEMIGDERFTFDVLDRESIVGCLSRVDGLDSAEYVRIVSENRAKVLARNSEDTYYEKILMAFNRAVEEFEKR